MHETTTGYRGRVRSGCLTCRSRKVKCDEGKPICGNCTRLQRDCTYKQRKGRRSIVAAAAAAAAADGPNIVNSTLDPLSRPQESSRSPNPPDISPPHQNSPSGGTYRLGSTSEASPLYPADRDPLPYSPTSNVDVTIRLERALHGREPPPTPDESQTEDAHSPSALISRDIELTTTMDLLTADSKLLHMSSSFFIEAAECPGITPYDGINWQIMKHHLVELGDSCHAIALAVSAVSALLKAQTYALSLSRALSLYTSAKLALCELWDDNNQDFSTALAATFLLCMFEFIHSGDKVPHLREPGESFTGRLKSWAQQPSMHSDQSMRLVAWLKILGATTLRGGGMGLISDTVYGLFPSYDHPLPNLKPPTSYESDVSSHLSQVLGAPLFDFYFCLQMLSGEIAQLTHYHRSRTTGVDQEEVAGHIEHVKARLRTFWENRPATQRQMPKDLRSQLAPQVAQYVVSLIGICDAAYHAEIVEMDRVLGDPVSKWTDSRESIQSIRDIVDGDWTQNERGDRGKLNSGYLRPLFLYAIECMNQDQNRWAVERIRQIQSPVYRSDFFSAFGKALSDVQVLKERRVTSKYFCISYFGVAPPFM